MKKKLSLLLMLVVSVSFFSVAIAKHKTCPRPSTLKFSPAYLGNFILSKHGSWMSYFPVENTPLADIRNAKFKLVYFTFPKRCAGRFRYKGLIGPCVYVYTTGNNKKSFALHFIGRLEGLVIFHPGRGGRWNLRKGKCTNNIKKCAFKVPPNCP